MLLAYSRRYIYFFHQASSLIVIWISVSLSILLASTHFMLPFNGGFLLAWALVPHPQRILGSSGNYTIGIAVGASWDVYSVAYVN